MSHARFAPQLLSPCPVHHGYQKTTSAQTAFYMPFRTQNPDVHLGPMRLVGVSQEIIDAATIGIIGWFACGVPCAAGGTLVGFVLSWFRRR